MAMQGEKPSPIAAIVGIVGGALLVIGSFLAWAKVSLDTAAFAQLLGSKLGIDPATIQAQLPSSGFSQTVKGMDGDGMFTLVAGIVVIAVAIVVLVKVDFNKIGGALMVLAALVGGGVALYDLLKLNDEKDKALAGAQSALTAAGLNAGDLGNIIKVSAGIGLWLCIVGGVIALIAGVMALVRKAPMAAVPVATSTGTGFESSPPAPAPTPAAEPVAPVAEPAPAPPVATSPEPPAPTPVAPEPSAPGPAAPQGSAPAPEAPSSDRGPEGGGDTSPS